jgi:sulfur-carrier protein
MIRVALPYHLRNLCQVRGEVELAVAPPVTLARALDALEQTYPVLRGTIRDQATGRRRPFLRFYACERDFSLEDPGVLLPEEVATGQEPLLVIGAIAGG